LTGERRVDLRAIEGTIECCPVRVRDELPRGVHDDDASARALGDRLCSRLPLVLWLGGEDGRGRHGLHLEVGHEGRSLIVVDDEGHGYGETEGDQGDQPGHREDEPAGHVLAPPSSASR
jgi:hypothetical protein